jgi:hypothetical protein
MSFMIDVNNTQIYSSLETLPSTSHSMVALNQVLTSPIHPFLEVAWDSALIRQSDINTQRNHSSSHMQQDIEVEA